jgi:ABC-type multidrug transport system ATPase subunit
MAAEPPAVSVGSSSPSKKFGADFTWQGVGYTVVTRNGDKEILSNISGQLSSGDVCALMGPSGSGKTSLLNVLAGRVRSRDGKQTISGDMRLGGKSLTGVLLRKRIAYVMQQDVLYATQTPREALLFSAKLRMPASVSLSEKSELVEKMLKDLGLTKCADTYIGNELMCGISGGEKKRTSVGIELIMRPKLVFLDEPTSGLDSYSAHQVIGKLRELADGSGCNILCTIHQPSSEVFHSFSKVIVLREGQLFFFGTVEQLSAQLSKLGNGCPSEYNLADHTMFLLMTGEENKITTLQEGLRLERESSGNSIKGDPPAEKPDNEGLGTAAGFCTQLLELSRREASAVWRDKPGLIASVMIPLILNLFFAFIFFQVGDTSQSNYDSQSHFGAIAQVAISGMFGAAQPLLLRFPLDRGIFLREYSTCTYGAVPYALSKSMVELPQSLLNSVIVWGSCYAVMGLHGNFIDYVLIFWITGMAASSVALLVGSVAANAEVASQAAPAIFVPQLLFAGFFIKIDNVPVFLRWVQYICALKYGMNLFLLNEFGEDARKDWPTEDQIEAERFITLNEVEPDHRWLYVGILIAIVIVIRSISLLVLARRASSFF